MDVSTALRTLSAPSRSRADLVLWRTACDVLVDHVAELSGSKLEIDTLKRLLADRDTYVRKRATAVLVQLARQGKAKASLFLRLKKDPEPVVRAEALAGLSTAAAAYGGQALSILKSVLRSKDAEVVNWAAPVLTSFGHGLTETTPLLIEWLCIPEISKSSIRDILNYIRHCGAPNVNTARRLFEIGKENGWFRNQIGAGYAFKALNTLLSVKSLYINYQECNGFESLIEELSARGHVKEGPKTGKEKGSEPRHVRPELDTLFASIPSDASCEELIDQFQKLGHDFRASIAQKLQPVLNERLKEMPQDSYADKQAVSSWVNAQLRSMGLAVKCPKTGRPGNLVADKKAVDSDISRFRVEIRDEKGKKARPFSARHLPELELIEDEPRREPLVTWAERVRQKPRTRSRE